MAGGALEAPLDDRPDYPSPASKYCKAFNPASTPTSKAPLPFICVAELPLCLAARRSTNRHLTYRAVSAARLEPQPYSPAERFMRVRVHRKLAAEYSCCSLTTHGNPG